MFTHSYTVAGTYTVTLTVTDTWGATGPGSCSITVTNVLCALNPALTSPAGGANLSNMVTLTATASTCAAQVQFYCDGTVLVGTATAAPFSVSWNTTAAANGTHTLAAKAFDAAGNATTSSSVTVSVNNNTAASPGQFQWVATPGSTTADYGYATATDAAGNVLVAGNWSYGPSIYLAKYSPSGGQLWWKTFTASGTPHGIVVDSTGNIYLTGEYLGSANFGGTTFSGNMLMASMFVAKFSSAGAHLWSKGFTTYAGPNIGRGVAVDPNGNVVLTGSFTSIDFGGGTLSGSGSLFVANLSGVDGSYLWAKQMGSGQACGNGLAVDGSGNVFVTGYYLNTISFGGGQLSTGGSGTYGGFLVKLTGSGAYVWSKGFGSFTQAPSTYGYGGNSVCVGANGNVSITGGFVGSVDFGGGPLSASPYATFDIFFATFSNSGGYLWAKHVSSSAGTSGVGYGAASDGSGNVVFTGVVYGTADFGGVSVASSGTFVAKYSPSGSCVWAKGCSGNNRGCGIDTDGNGNVVVTGFWSGASDFGNGTLNSVSGGTDVFLLKFAP
jgi:hypothetical protein